MNKIKKALRVAGFVCLLLLALAGIGLPIPLYLRDRYATKEFHQEQIDEKEDMDQDILLE